MRNIIIFVNGFGNDIGITQASYFNEMEQERQRNQRIENRLSEIKPELAIAINGRNVRIPHIDRWPSEKLYLAMFGEPLPDKYKEKHKTGSAEDAIIHALNTSKMIKEYHIDNVWVSDGTLWETQTAL